MLEEIAKSYIRLLVDRCLFEEERFPQGIVFLKSHDVLRDMAIYIGEKEENCLFRAGQMHEQFTLEVRENCKRMSLYDNNIRFLPQKGLKCTKLVSLILRGNKELEEIPEEFLINFTCLKVLDLSRTKIKALPTSLWQLGGEFMGKRYLIAAMTTKVSLTFIDSNYYTVIQIDNTMTSKVSLIFFVVTCLPRRGG